MNTIADNVMQIQANIARASARANRDPSKIQLIGVTKTIEIERINELLSAGVTALGENKPQELARKYDAIGTNARWHMIGHLQTNKVKMILDKVRMIHSVDNLRLAESISKHAAVLQKEIEILIEVNIADEPTKHGATPQDTVNFAGAVLQLPFLILRGLMCVAPYVEHPENNRIFFEHLRQLYIDIQEKYGHNVNLEHLSMGMTNDYEVAIEEGATMVRIGTGIFGER